MFVVVAALPALLSGDDGTGPVAVVLLLPRRAGRAPPARCSAPCVRVVERRHPPATSTSSCPSWRQSVGLVALLRARLARHRRRHLGRGPRARSRRPSCSQVGAAAVLSWVVGFVLVPVPGGVGVREAAFVAAAGSLDPGIAAAVAVAARAIFVIVDAVGALIGSASLRRPAASSAPDRVRSSTGRTRCDVLGRALAERPTSLAERERSGRTTDTS